MKKVQINELSEPIRLFLEQLRDGESIMVEDENGRLQCGITPYFKATNEERQQAWRDLEELQDRVAASMDEQGITEEDVDRLLQEND